jgi:hypothetical protein
MVYGTYAEDVEGEEDTVAKGDKAFLIYLDFT